MSPCLKQIDAACFKTHPKWAKQAFAYKMVHLLFPPQVTKLLPKVLRRALIAPGVHVPAGIELQPGIVVGPDTEFPPALTIGDPFPAGVIDPVTLPPDISGPGVAPSSLIDPFAPGPVHTPSPSPPAEEAPFFYDDFNVLDPLVWTDIDESAGGVISIVDGRVEFDTTIPGTVYIQRTESEPWPDVFDITFDHAHMSGTDSTTFRIQTGSYLVLFRFIPPSSVKLSGPVTHYPNVTDYAGELHKWRLVVNGAFADLYQHDVLKYSGHEWSPNIAEPGLMKISLGTGARTLIDDFTIIDQTV